MALTPSSHPATSTEPTYPVVRFYNDPVQAITLRAIAHALGHADTSCPKFAEPFNEVLFTQLYPPLGKHSHFTSLMPGTYPETARITMRELLAREYQDGASARREASSGQSTKEPLHAYVASLAPEFACNRADSHLKELLQKSDLYRVTLPVLDSLLPMTGEYLVRRIPPHVGHGVRRTLAFEGEEAIQREKEAEAQQDRGSASQLFEHLKTFLTEGTLESFQVFMRNFYTSGDWLSWIAQPPPAGAPHPHAEQVLANTVALLHKFKEFSAEYERAFMTPGQAAHYSRWHWYDTCKKAGQVDPLAYPLFAGALEIFTRQDFKERQ